MEALFKDWTEWVAVAVEAAAVVVVMLAAAQAAVGAVLVYIAPPRRLGAGTEAVRLRLARWLAVALEFTLAADILRTAIAPTWDDIGKLAAIATLRTVLNFFLQREIATAERHEQAAGRG